MNTDNTSSSTTPVPDAVSLAREARALEAWEAARAALEAWEAEALEKSAEAWEAVQARATAWKEPQREIHKKSVKTC